ncbi:MAG: hypothetical protein H6509_12120 [Bryobacterales bacterium]|nr:hypothetical protein [Acidobacteriota bacterium]MCB9385351.1 hypothetical protein [Bryobacterales bacterium]
MLRKLADIPGIAAFAWRATKGYRLRPWASPYLRWRIETFSGLPAEAINRETFLRFMSENKASTWGFLRWAARMRRDHRA